MNLEDTG